MDKLLATRVVIAHRLSTIVNADCIYYLEDGAMKESGTYQQLMDKNGAFAQLALRQPRDAGADERRGEGASAARTRRRRESSPELLAIPKPVPRPQTDVEQSLPLAAEAQSTSGAPTPKLAG